MAALLSYALTTLADVKESLGIESADSSKDNLIIRKINQATIAIERYCQRRFAETTYTEAEYHAPNIDQLTLKQRPVTDTTTFVFEVRNTGLNVDSWDEIDSQLYFVDASSGIINLTYNATGGWEQYRVTYSAGYTSIPDDLAEACATLACFYINNADAMIAGTAEKQEGQRSIRYNNANLSFTNVMKQLGIDQIIDSYANYPVAET